MNQKLLTANIHVREVERHRQLLDPVFDCDYIQLTPGDANVRLTLATNGTALLYREAFEAQVRVFGALREGLVGFAFPTDRTASRSKWWQTDYPENGIAARVTSREVDVAFCPRGEKYIFAMEQNRFHELFQSLGGYELDLLALEDPFVSMPRKSAAACREAYDSYLKHLFQYGEDISNEEFESQLVDILATFLVPPIETFYTPKQRSGLVKRALAEIESISQIPSVTSLCLKLKASKRSLTYAFKECLGVSPAQYLRLHRLNRCRHDYAHSSPGETTVQAVAKKMGFSGAGPFASLYRDFFGEYPSETLNRPALKVTPVFSLL